MNAMTALPTERQVQRAILQMCGTCFPDVFITAVPNGAHLAGSDTARFKQMGALKGDGLKVGFPDLIFMWSPGRVGFMEVKRPKTGRVSPEQGEVLQRLYDLGFPFAVVDNADAAHERLLEWGAPCKARLAA